MRFTPRFYSRLGGATVMGDAGYAFGIANSPAPPTPTQRWATSLLMLCGVALGLILTPYLTVDPIRRLLARARSTAFMDLVAGLIGLLAGLVASVLATVPLAHLPWPAGAFAPSVVQELLVVLRLRSRQRPAGARNRRTLVDTSIVVDGRIGDVIKTGFLTETLLVPANRVRG